MPRANHYFLPDYVWHNTHQRCGQFQSFQSFKRCAPFKPLRRGNRGNFHFFRTPTGSGFQPRFSASNPIVSPKLHAVIEDLPLGAQVSKGF
jgi:hypothetical protein